MVAVEEETCIEIILPRPPPSIIKPVELTSVGFLEKDPIYITCPSCFGESVSVVRLEVVTCWQKFLKATNLCQTSDSHHDVNHYCGICGCYIGRYVSLGCSERCISKQARKKAANDAMTLKTKPKDCAEHMQKARERVKINRAKQKAKRNVEKQENTANDSV